MTQYTASLSRDANYVPIQAYGFGSQKSQTLSGSNATVSTPLFRITGNIVVKALYGTITTTLGANVTATYWRTNDQTAQINISLNTGTAISAAAVGSQITRLSTAGVALVFDNTSAAKVRDPVAATAPDVFMPFEVMQKVGGINTDIEFTYSTTDTPTSGVIQHTLRWLPVSDNANVTVL